MKTFFIYCFLIASGFGIGTLCKKFYNDYRSSQVEQEALETIKKKELTQEELAQYRRAHNAAIAHKQERNLPKAINHIETMLDIAPHYPQSHVLYAETTLELMRWVRGVDVVSSDMANIEVIQHHVLQANRLAPNDFDVLKLNIHFKDWMALIARKFNDEIKMNDFFSQAQQELTTARKLWGHEKKKSAILLLEEINLLRHMERFQEALDKLAQALKNKELQFMKGQLCFNEALIYISLDNVEQVELSFKKALEGQGAPIPLIYLNRGNFYLDKGYYHLALDDFESIRKMYPDDDEINMKIKEVKSKITLKDDQQLKSNIGQASQ